MTSRERASATRTSSTRSAPGTTRHEPGKVFGMPCVKRAGKVVFGFSRTGMVFKLTDPNVHRRARPCRARTSSTRPAGARPFGSGWWCLPPRQVNGRRSPTTRSARTRGAAGGARGGRRDPGVRLKPHAASTEVAVQARARSPSGRSIAVSADPRAAQHLRPAAQTSNPLAIAVDADVLTRLEHDLVVAAVEWLLRPPAVDDPPFLAHECDLLAVDDAGEPSTPARRAPAAAR